MSATEKKQMNVYIPEDLDEYIEQVCEEVGISKSDFVRLWLSYSRRFCTPDIIRKLAGAMMMFGEDGLVMVHELQIEDSQ